MDIGMQSARTTGRPGNSASSDSICQHTQRHSKTLGHTRSPRLIGPGLQPSHASAKSTSRKHTVLESSRDHTESCSASPPKAECSAAEHQSLKQQGELRIAMLGLCSLSVLHRQQSQPRFERSQRRWFGLRPGKLVVVEGQTQQLDTLQRVVAGAQEVIPVEAWTAVGGFLLAMLFQWVAAAIRGRAARRKQREEAQREARLQAQKASYRHRSRFQRALGDPSAEASVSNLDGEEYDGLPEDSFTQPADREEDLELEETVAEEAEEEEPWEYDAEALKHWEQFVKKSKVTQVSEGSWWDMEAAALDDRAIALSQEKRDWNA
ncbi:g11398 [Coccomyxa viridis]|uniref:G11398 protein n=1 Tax=Coccomyxa viridis TaxID=1274662 RepID=A0ABP1GDK1_9CHLO